MRSVRTQGIGFCPSGNAPDHVAARDWATIMIKYRTRLRCIRWFVLFLGCATLRLSSTIYPSLTDASSPRRSDRVLALVPSAYTKRNLASCRSPPGLHRRRISRREIRAPQLAQRALVSVIIGRVDSVRESRSSETATFTMSPCGC